VTRTSDKFRCNLAVGSALRPSNPNYIINAVAEWPEIDIRATLLCCFKVSDRWVVVGESRSRAAAFSTLDEYAEEFSAGLTEGLPLSVNTAPPRLMMSFGYNSCGDATTIYVFSRCLWIAVGDNARKCADFLVQSPTLLESATQLAMAALAKQMEESERSLSMISTEVKADISMALLSCDGRSTTSAPSTEGWSRIPSIIRVAWERAREILADNDHSSEYDVDAFCIYQPIEDPSWTSSLYACRASDGAVIEVHSGGSEVAALRSRAAIVLAGESASAHSSADHQIAAAVIIPILPLHESFNPVGYLTFRKKVKSPKGVGSPQKPAVMLTASDARRVLSTGEYSFSVEELTHVTAIANAVSEPLSVWLRARSVADLQLPIVQVHKEPFRPNECFSALEELWTAFMQSISSDNATSTRRRMSATERFALSLSPSEDDSADEVVLTAAAHGRHLGVAHSVQPPSGLTRLISQSLGCDWSAVAIIAPSSPSSSPPPPSEQKGSPPAVTVMDSRGEVFSSRSVESVFGLIAGSSELAAAVASEETRLLRTMKLYLLQGEPVASPAAHLFHGVDLLRAGLAAVALPDLPSSLRRSNDEAALAPGWSVSMLVIGVPSEDSTGTSRGTAVVFGGRRWHSPAAAAAPDGLKTTSEAFSLRLQSLLHVMAEHRRMIHVVQSVVPEQLARLQQYSSAAERAEARAAREAAVLRSFGDRLSAVVQSAVVSSPAGAARCLIWHAIADSIVDVLSCTPNCEWATDSAQFELRISDSFCNSAWILNPSANGAWDPADHSSTSDGGKYVDVELFAVDYSARATDASPSSKPKIDNSILLLRLYLKSSTDPMKMPAAAHSVILLNEDGHALSQSEVFVKFIIELRSCVQSVALIHSETTWQSALFSIPQPRNFDKAAAVGAGLVVSPAVGRVPKCRRITDELSESLRLSSAFCMSVAADCVASGPEQILDDIEWSAVAVHHPHQHQTGGGRSDVAAMPASLWRASCAAGSAYLGAASFWNRLFSAFSASPSALPAASVAPLVVFAHGPQDDLRYDVFDMLSGDIFDEDSSGDGSGNRLGSALGYASMGDGNFRKSAVNMTPGQDTLPAELVVGVLSALKGADPQGPAAAAAACGSFSRLSGEASAALAEYMSLRSATHPAALRSSEREPTGNKRRGRGASGISVLVHARLPGEPHTLPSITPASAHTHVCTASYAVLIHISTAFPIPPDYFSLLISTAHCALQPLQFIRPITQLQMSRRDLQLICNAAASNSSSSSHSSSYLPAHRSREDGIDPSSREHSVAIEAHRRTVRRLSAVCGAAVASAAAEAEADLLLRYASRPSTDRSDPSGNSIISTGSSSSSSGGGGGPVGGEVYLYSGGGVYRKVISLSGAGEVGRTRGSSGLDELGDTLLSSDVHFSSSCRALLTSSEVPPELDSSGDASRSSVQVGVIEVPAVGRQERDSPSKHTESGSSRRAHISSSSSSSSRLLLRVSILLPRRCVGALMSSESDGAIAMENAPTEGGTSDSSPVAFCVILVNAPACCRALVHNQADSADISRRSDRLLQYVSWLARSCAGQIHAAGVQAMLFHSHHDRYREAVDRAVSWIKAHSDWSASSVASLRSALLRAEGPEGEGDEAAALPSNKSARDIHSRLFAAEEDIFARDLKLLDGHASALQQVSSSTPPPTAGDCRL
jgi:hypothetical protein